MSRFIKKALEKVSRLDKDQLVQFLQDVVQEHELLEASLNSLPWGLVVLDSEGRVLYHNKASERLLLLSSQGLEGTDKPFLSLLRDPDVSAFLRKAFDDHETQATREFSFSSSQGTRLVRLSLLPLVRDNCIQGTMLLLQDMTEQKNRDRRLRRAESLANLTTLAAGVAHEIKNPLGSIGIHIQLIQRALKNGDKNALANVYHDLEIINEEIDRLGAIVVDFLFAVRPMDTTLMLDSLSHVVQEMVEFLHHELEQNNIQVILDLDTQQDSILLDERYLKQAILNVVKNSMQAMPQGGRLFIQTKKTNEAVLLTLSDTGCGMLPELVEKIFEPYFTTKDNGSGLGLTLVDKIVQAHGADIQVTSKPDWGTEVRISFPLPNQTTPLLDFKGDKK